MSKIVKIAKQFAKDLGVELKHVQVAKVQDKIIFSSGDSLRIITAVSKEQVLTQLQNKFKEKPEQVELILNADPTPNKGYSIWIGKLLLSKNIILPEDANKILDKINLFEEFKKKGKIKGVDINRLKTYQELAKVVEEANGTKTQGETYRENLDAGQELIFQNEKLKVVKITTVEATTELCRGMENWCVKDPAYSEAYLASGPLILVYHYNSPFVLIHEASGSAKNEYDESINGDIGNGLAEIVDHLGITTFKDDLEVILYGIPDDKILSDLGTYHEEALRRELISLDKYVSIIQKLTPEELAAKLYIVAARRAERLPAKFEKYFIGNPRICYNYATSVVGGRFELGEKTLAENAYFASIYAEDVIRGRFELGEEALSKDPIKAYFYAQDILKGRFPAGEAVIAKEGELAYRYATRIIGGRWPEGEEAILKHFFYAERYENFLDKSRAHE